MQWTLPAGKSRRTAQYGEILKNIIDRLICEQYLQYSQQKHSKNNPNFGRAVERERSELRNASPKERKPQVWKQKMKKWKKNTLFRHFNHDTLEWRAILSRAPF